MGVPWWRLATVVLLSTGVAIAVVNGHVAEAAIIAILLLPSVAFLAAWVYAARRRYK
jgi:hypothetical protein